MGANTFDDKSVIRIQNSVKVTENRVLGNVGRRNKGGASWVRSSSGTGTTYAKIKSAVTGGVYRVDIYGNGFDEGITEQDANASTLTSSLATLEVGREIIAVKATQETMA